jgi:hypothetical protein
MPFSANITVRKWRVSFYSTSQQSYRAMESWPTADNKLDKIAIESAKVH